MGTEITFQYKKDSHFLLELHIGKKEAKKLKKQIKNNNLLIIETEKYNEKYKYVIEETHSCELNKGVLKIEFNGKVYKNDELSIYEQLKHFTHKIEDPHYTFYQLERGSEAKETLSSIVQDQQSEPNDDNVVNTYYNPNMHCPFNIVCMSYLALGATLSAVVGPGAGVVFIASGIIYTLIAGTTKIHEKASENQLSDTSTRTTVETVLQDASVSRVKMPDKTSGKS
ncbi:hypothetical protein IC220_06285 [Wolbachia endosymbiont of Pentalonia nigronervosa]|jgi:hypothetical protein|uniref:hypothetical protein n=1 Tax=Wolbachia endosymbiont of Pentalonia nigronervosa TaxID=1301914 RepID=UPI00165EE2AE|nr:hypothetical protein [Wolbachia endosymbiont of Pentalonia nigronervosa]MBD0392022.1 hypothetical protein [Wolbachia endosymbiont of Pentalonia nigronervosa]